MVIRCGFVFLCQIFDMKVILYGCLFLMLFSSCKDEDPKRIEAQKMAEIKQDSIFKEITKHWQFRVPAPYTKASEVLQTWTQWREFTFELNQKPSVNLSNFRNKASVLSQKVKLLQSTLPPVFQIPEIKSRVLVLQTRINSLELFLNLDQIPTEKIKVFCNEINEEMVAIVNQMDAVFVRADIPLEEGELETRQQLKDTTRLANKILQKDLDFE